MRHNEKLERHRSFVFTLYLLKYQFMYLTTLREIAGLAAHNSGRTSLSSVTLTAAHIPLQLPILWETLRVPSIVRTSCTQFFSLLMNLFLSAQCNEALPYYNVSQSIFRLYRPFYMPVSFIIPHLHGNVTTSRQVQANTQQSVFTSFTKCLKFFTGKSGPCTLTRYSSGLYTLIHDLRFSQRYSWWF